MGKADRKSIDLNRDLVPEGYTASTIGPEFIDEIVLLEPQIYPKGWSRGLVESEFANLNSIRVGVFDKTTQSLIGYSFSRIVEDEFHLLNIGLLPGYRGLGLGSFLLCEVLEIAKVIKCTVAHLEVRKSNSSARSLYQIAGFREVGQRLAYYADNQEDAILMELSLL